MNLLKGYLSLIEEFFFLKNDQEFFKLNQNIFLTIIILGIIGLIRNTVCAVVAMLWFANVKFDTWFALNFEISNVMFWFPVFLAFFGSMVIHLVTKILKQNISYQKLFALMFYLQLVHLSVLVIDAIFVPFVVPIILYKIPFGRGWWPYFSYGSTMSYGIVGAWLIATFLTYKVFTKYFKVSPLYTIIILLISFNFLYWPVYHFFPLYNFIFAKFAKWCFGAQISYHKYYGYGIFFMLGAIVGIIYHLFKQNIYCSAKSEFFNQS